MPMLDCVAPQTLDDLKAAIARGEDTIALSAEQLREWSSSIAERHDNVYHSRELELRPLTPKAVHVVIRNQERIVIERDVVVTISDGSPATVQEQGGNRAAEQDGTMANKLKLFFEGKSITVTSERAAKAWARKELHAERLHETPTVDGWQYWDARNKDEDDPNVVTVKVVGH
jgi:hypothetical protein